MFFRVLESRDDSEAITPWGNGATPVSIGTLRNIKNCLDEFERRTWSFFSDNPFVGHGDMFSEFFGQLHKNVQKFILKSRWHFKEVQST